MTVLPAACRCRDHRPFMTPQAIESVSEFQRCRSATQQWRYCHPVFLLSGRSRQLKPPRRAFSVNHWIRTHIHARKKDVALASEAAIKQPIGAIVPFEARQNTYAQTFLRDCDDHATVTEPSMDRLAQERGCVLRPWRAWQRDASGATPCGSRYSSGARLFAPHASAPARPP